MSASEAWLPGHRTLSAPRPAMSSLSRLVLLLRDSVVELIGDTLQLSWFLLRRVDSTGQVLPEETLGVLVRAAPPRCERRHDAVGGLVSARTPTLHRGCRHTGLRACAPSASRAGLAWPAEARCRSPRGRPASRAVGRVLAEEAIARTRVAFRYLPSSRARRVRTPAPPAVEQVEDRSRLIGPVPGGPVAADHASQPGAGALRQRCPGRRVSDWSGRYRRRAGLRCPPGARRPGAGRARAPPRSPMA